MPTNPKRWFNAPKVLCTRKRRVRERINERGEMVGLCVMACQGGESSELVEYVRLAGGAY